MVISSEEVNLTESPSPVLASQKSAGPSPLGDYPSNPGCSSPSFLSPLVSSPIGLESWFQSDQNGLVYPAYCDFHSLDEPLNLLISWALPGFGEAYDSCGKTKVLDLCSWDTKHVPRKVLFNCLTPSCPVCYEGWTNDLAMSATLKLLCVEASAGISGLRHHLLSPPQDRAIDMMHTLRGMRKLWKWHHEAAKALGLIGGASIFHPWRWKHDDGSDCERISECKQHHVQIEAPHFHALAWGTTKPSNEFFEATGWVHKNLGLRKTVWGTLKYQLTHCGLAMGSDGSVKVQTVHYFGVAANCKLEKTLVKDEKVFKSCSVCGADRHKFKETDDGLQDLGPIMIHNRTYRYRVKFRSEMRSPSRSPRRSLREQVLERADRYRSRCDFGSPYAPPVYPSDLDWQTAGPRAPAPIDNLQDLELLIDTAGELGDLETVRSLELRLDGVVSRVRAKWASNRGRSDG